MKDWVGKSSLTQTEPVTKIKKTNASDARSQQNWSIDEKTVVYKTLQHVHSYLGECKNPKYRSAKAVEVNRAFLIYCSISANITASSGRACDKFKWTTLIQYIVEPLHVRDHLRTVVLASVGVALGE
jgi:hypothetical protein